MTNSGMPLPEERFATLLTAFRGDPDVSLPDEAQSRQRFGSSELKIHNKIFAMLFQNNLVVKLPKLRVDELVAAGAGERFGMRKDGRLMKEWLVVSPAADLEWLVLAREALAFVDPVR